MFYIHQRYFFWIFFFTLFSTPMYAWRPFLLIFVDLALFITWKRPKNGRKVEIRPKIGYSSKCPGTIFPVNLFSLFFLHQCIHRDHTPRRFSIYHFLLCGSVQKMAAKLKFGKNRLFLPMVTCHFFCIFSLFFRYQCIHRDHTSRRLSIWHFLLCGSLQKWP